MCYTCRTMTNYNISINTGNAGSLFFIFRVVLEVAAVAASGCIVAGLH